MDEKIRRLRSRNEGRGERRVTDISMKASFCRLSSTINAVPSRRPAARRTFARTASPNPVSLAAGTDFHRRFSGGTRERSRVKRDIGTEARSTQLDEPAAKRVCGFQLFEHGSERERQQQRLRQLRIDHHCRLLRDRTDERPSDRE